VNADDAELDALLRSVPPFDFDELMRDAAKAEADLDALLRDVGAFDLDALTREASATDLEPYGATALRRQSHP